MMEVNNVPEPDSFLTSFNNGQNGAKLHDPATVQVDENNPDEKKIFTQVKVWLNNVIIKQLPENPETFLSSLKEKCGVLVEDNIKSSEKYVLQGQWNQIVDAYERIEYTLKASNQPSESTAIQKRGISIDKAVTCDIIQGDALTKLPSENMKQPRLVSVIVHRNRSPSRRIMEKYRRINVKPKAVLKPCLKTSNKMTKVSEDEVAEKSNGNSDLENVQVTTYELDTENVNSTEAQNTSPNNTKKKKPKKNYEELTPFKFFCKLCSFKTKRESHYQKHLEIHKKVTTLYKCEDCNFTSIRLSHMRRHEITHSQTTISCTQCSYKTDNMKLLVRHMKIKHEKDEEEQPKDLLQCAECTYQTTKQYHFQRHLRVHSCSNHNHKPLFQCDKCVYKTARKEHYIRHVNNVHANKRPYLCDFCGKAFKRTDALKQHRVIHSTVDPLGVQFRCSVCDKICRSQAHLLEHQAVHSNVRSFLCEICGASFKTRSVQRKHVLTIHKKPRAFCCQFCDKRFNTNYALRRHVRLHEIGSDSSTSQRLFDAATTTQTSAAESLSTNVAQQSVILLPGDGQLQSSGELNGSSIPFTIHPNVLGNNSTIHLLHGSDSIVSGSESTTLMPLHESISGEDGQATAQTFIQPNEATTALLYLTTNFTPF